MFGNSAKRSLWIAFQVLRIFDFTNLLKQYPGGIKSFPAPIQKTSSAPAEHSFKALVSICKMTC
ncbi:hypothetical protein LEP1GSC040_3466 [Leptospira santarosai str. 2000030832]|nr:hypothetical protein LEP1GSC040_3466 [Leptospira santarosai str. 2000030832]